MSNLEKLKVELQAMVDKGTITAKQYQEKIDSSIEQDDNYKVTQKEGTMRKKHIFIALVSGIVGLLCIISFLKKEKKQI